VSGGSPRRALVLGSTGSVGRQTLEVIAALNAIGDGGGGARLEVVGLAAGRNAGLLAEQARRFGVSSVAISDGGADEDFGGARVMRGAGGAEELVRSVDADLVVAAIVGSAGLGPTLAALELGRDVAIANKETLVSAGALAVELAERTGARMLPVDSEHSGVWQCLPGWPAAPMAAGDEVARVTLTASGGALRDADDAAYDAAGVDEALAHPTWEMGAKITVDCATLMNKALELIEARWLFGLGNDRLGVLIHHQSIVHALVEMRDGSVLAQLGTADMRTAIQAALAWPDRAGVAAAPRLDLAAAGALAFSEPEVGGRHAALGLARRVIEGGGTLGAALTAGNEEAVAAFLEGRVTLGRVTELAAEAMESAGVGWDREEGAPGLGAVREAEGAAREVVRTRVGAGARPARGAVH